MKKRNLVVANWKMNPTSLEEAKKIFNMARKVAGEVRNTDIAICPPFPFIFPLSKLNYPKNVFLGAQNVSAEEKGAFTGEVSGAMIKSLGAKFVIVGHSERRYPPAGGGEDNVLIKKKLEAAFNAGLTPILCLGEKVRDKEGTHLAFIKNQVKECLSGLQKKNLVGLIIAYEPVWAIGKSYRDAMNPTDVHEMTLFIKKAAGELFGQDIADSFRMLYGAAVEPENTKILFEQGNISGLLIGHASLTPQFAEILKAANLTPSR